MPVYLFVLSCAPAQPIAERRSDHPYAVIDSTLRAELLARLGADQAARAALVRQQMVGQTLTPLTLSRADSTDAANTRWLSDVVATRGWPGRSLVGTDGAQASVVLLQHADRDTAFQTRLLPVLERAYTEGEVEGQQVALLTDRIAVARHRPQVYGTQADVAHGRIVLKPISDSAGVDGRRAKLGLPPLAEYLRLLEMHYLGKTSP